MNLGYLVRNQDDFLERVRIVAGRQAPQITSTEDLFIAPNGEEIKLEKMSDLVSSYERRVGIVSDRKLVVQGYSRNDDNTRFLDSSYSHVAYGNEAIPIENVLRLTENPRI